MTYSQSTLEAIAGMAPATLEYNRGVLTAIGKPGLAVSWAMTYREADDAGKALTARIEGKHAGDQIAAMLDTGMEFAQEHDRLNRANDRYAQVWKDIQILIDEAREALYR
jgi:hypothetical protein